MTINIFVFKGDLNGKNRSGAFLFLSGIYCALGQTWYLIVSIPDAFYLIWSVACLAAYFLFALCEY